MAMHVRKEPAAVVASPSPVRRQRGRIAALSGAMAEEMVQRHYLARGAELLASRWRGMAGEIDLVFRHGEVFVFVEVKKAATHALAAQSLRPSQMGRICVAACEFCDRHGLGSLVEMRLDVALVDQIGRVELIENAFWES